MRKRVIKLKTERYLELLEDYRGHIQIMGYSEQVRTVKYANLAEFFQWLEKKDIYEIKQVSPGMIKAYYAYLQVRPHKKLSGVLSLQTVIHHMRNLRVFFSYLQQSGLVITNPMSTLKFSYPKKASSKRTVLTLKEVRELYGATENLTERVILSLGYGLGLRAMELVGVSMEDIRMHQGILVVPKGKGNKRRVIPMSAGVRSDIENYIENERDLYLKDETTRALILNIKGDRMQRYTCRKILRRLIDRTANETIIGKKISIHNLRHSIATHLLGEGVPIEQVRNFLGHAHIETTEIYTRVNQSQLKKLLQ